MTDLIPRDAAIGALEDRRDKYRQDSPAWMQIQMDVLAIHAIPIIHTIDPAAIRDAALREAVKSLRDWQAHLNRHSYKETAITVGMAADAVEALIGEKK